MKVRRVKFGSAARYIRVLFYGIVMFYKEKIQFIKRLKGLLRVMKLAKLHNPL